MQEIIFIFYARVFYTQSSQGNLLFFHYKSQEGKDLQEREGGLFAVSFSEKSSLPLPK
jgi:hypothetical protein